MFQPALNVTPEMKQHQTRLFFIFGIGLVLAICKVVGNAAFALNEILVLMLFLCGTMYTNYCMIVFYIILTLFSMISYLMEFGRMIQVYFFVGSSQFASLDAKMKFFYVILVITFVFDIFAIMFSFWAYKSFKYETFKGSMAGTVPMQDTRRQNEAAQNQSRGPTPFQGRGIRIGD